MAEDVPMVHCTFHLAASLKLLTWHGTMHEPTLRWRKREPPEICWTKMRMLILNKGLVLLMAWIIQWRKTLEDFEVSDSFHVKRTWTSLRSGHFDNQLCLLCLLSASKNHIHLVGQELCWCWHLQTLLCMYGNSKPPWTATFMYQPFACDTHLSVIGGTFLTRCLWHSWIDRWSVPCRLHLCGNAWPRGTTHCPNTAWLPSHCPYVDLSYWINHHEIPFGVQKSHSHCKLELSLAPNAPSCAQALLTMQQDFLAL